MQLQLIHRNKHENIWTLASLFLLYVLVVPERFAVERLLGTQLKHYTWVPCAGIIVIPCAIFLCLLWGSKVFKPILPVHRSTHNTWLSMYNILKPNYCITLVAKLFHLEPGEHFEGWKRGKWLPVSVLLWDCSASTSGSWTWPKQVWRISKT